MQYAAGGSLGDALKKWGCLCENVVRRYTGQILDGLMFLNNRGISHRDIKPGNVLMHDGVIKLADFGTAKQTGVESTENSPRAKESFTDGHVGTAIYMSPEVMMAGEDKNPKNIPDGKKSDIWSLGCTIVEMATGATCFRRCVIYWK